MAYSYPSSSCVAAAKPFTLNLSGFWQWLVFDKPKHKGWLVDEAGQSEKISRARFCVELNKRYQCKASQIRFNVRVPGAVVTCAAAAVVYLDERANRPFMVVEFVPAGEVISKKLEDICIDAVEKAKLIGAPFVVVVEGDTKRVIDVELWTPYAIEQALLEDIPVLPNDPLSPVRLVD